MDRSCQGCRRVGFVVASLLLLFLGAAVVPVHAVPVVTLPSTAHANSLGAWTIGWQFQANRDTHVTALGVYDDYMQNGPGLAESHEVSIWEDQGFTGALLVTATVPAGTGSTLDQHFRFVSVAPVWLQRGHTYRIGAYFATAADGYFSPWQVSEAGVFDPAVTFLDDCWSPLPNASQAYPSNLDVPQGLGMFGPSFALTPAPVPEPAAAGLAVVALGVLGVALNGRRTAAARRAARASNSV
jgi:hypothetical protein